MNHIFKKIWNKSLGRMIVVSETAKSAGKTANATGTTENSLSNAHYDEQGKNEVLVFKSFVLHSLVLSIAAITGSNVWAGDVCDGSNTTDEQTLSSTAIGIGAYEFGVEYCSDYWSECLGR